MVKKCGQAKACLCEGKVCKGMIPPTRFKKLGRTQSVGVRISFGKAMGYFGTFSCLHHCVPMMTHGQLTKVLAFAKNRMEQRDTAESSGEVSQKGLLPSITAKVEACLAEVEPVDQLPTGVVSAGGGDDILLPFKFPKKALQAFVLVYFVFLADFLSRAGVDAVQRIRAKLIKKLPASSKRGFTKFQRCMFSSLVDSTSLWLIREFVMVYSGPWLLYLLVVAVIVMNHHYRLAVLSTRLAKQPLSAFEYCRMFIKWKAGSPKHPCNREGVAAGLRCSTAVVVNTFMRSLGRMEVVGHNDQTLGCSLFIGHVAGERETAFAGIEEHGIFSIVKKPFFVVNLPAVQVARLLSLRYAHMFDGETSDFVGERAGWQLEDMLGVERGSLSETDLRLALRSLVGILKELLKSESVRVFGAEATELLFAVLPLGLKSFYDCTLIEHLLSEAYKISHPETGTSRRAGLSDDEYRQLLYKAFPDWRSASQSVFPGGC